MSLPWLRVQRWPDVILIAFVVMRMSFKTMAMIMMWSPWLQCWQDIILIAFVIIILISGAACQTQRYNDGNENAVIATTTVMARHHFHFPWLHRSQSSGVGDVTNIEGKPKLLAHRQWKNKSLKSSEIEFPSQNRIDRCWQRETSRADWQRNARQGDWGGDPPVNWWATSGRGLKVICPSPDCLSPTNAQSLAHLGNCWDLENNWDFNVVDLIY